MMRPGKSQRSVIDKLFFIGLNLTEIDTTSWKVDKGAHIFNRYTLTMIEEMFLSGSVSMEKETRVRVLSIGLGAGYVNSYLHHHFPKMDITVVELDPKIADIAKKWFDLTLDDKQRLIIGDGVQFIKTAVERGEKYDIVLLDACSWYACLIATKMKIAQIFSSLLNKKGALVANVFSKNDPLKVGAKVKSYYSTVFRYCSLRKSPNSNLIMTCTNQPRPEGLEERYGLFMKYPNPKLLKVELI